MKRRIEEMIPLAMQVIENYEKFQDEEKKEMVPIPSTFQGSISSMGASIIQMGLLPTIAVFADKDSGTQDDQRLHLLEILKRVLIKYRPKLYSGMENHDNLLKYVAQDKNIHRRFKDDLMDAAVAVKLSLRTFKIDRS